MTSTPELTPSKEVPMKKMRPEKGEEVVVSGMSGIFPKSDSVEDFMKNLFDKVDMVSSENPRWVFNHPELPKHLGRVNGMGKFDAQFFRVHNRQAFTMEPMSRKLLEHAYSAIYDSGMNPMQLRGKKVGVFIGSTFSESEKVVIYENIIQNGFGITGCNKAMYANRISYWMDGKGPSYSLDLACASSMACVEHAYRSISTGQCEAAIVGGCNLCMHPNVSLNCKRAGFLCMDGKTKCFDKNGDGHVRSDAIGVLFLQKAKDAKRIYSEVYHAKTSFSPSAVPLMPVRNPKDIQQFLEAFYSEIDVSPEDVEYIEANGAAFVQADSNELEAIGTVFAKKSPIKVGCVKSNMGSSEPASGICAMTKVCLAYHSGKVPGNLNYNEPMDVRAVKENKIQVLTDAADFSGGFAALNSFSYSGANIHVLLKGHNKEKDSARYTSSIPHLVLLSGRQEACLERPFEILKNKPVDPEEINLLHGIHQYEIPGHMSRGYSILDTKDDKTVCLSQSIEYCPGNKHPIWFVYSGMGSQWATMGAQLMRIPVFAAAIQKCHNVLEPKGIDIVNILTVPDKSIYDNILHSFVGIAAVQIGLTDILNEMGIVPDNIIGHSVGELGCAYADGCFTAEEMILSAYSRGLVSIQTPFIRGSMAAVGLGYKAVLPLCPPEIEVACHNSSDSATISGPANIMKEFVAQLQSKGIFAREVPCSNIAYHSKYISDAGPGLLKYLSEVIRTPKLRSKKWLSTSVPKAKWDEPIAQYSSAEYHTNNLLNPVLFEETSKLIPADALVIEIAPHGLLQAILKRSMTECVHVPLTLRGSPDPVKYLLEALGKLYLAGLNPKIDILYPKIDYPVSSGTPLLSQYVEWVHTEDWSQATYNNKDRIFTTVRHLVMSVHDDDYAYFRGHVREGNCVFPEAAFLQLTWETLAMHHGVNYKDMSVVFKDVHFHREVFIKSELPVKIEIMIHKGNEKFEITDGDFPLVSGYISTSKHFETPKRNLEESVNADMVTLNSQDIYTIMNLRGYSYKGEFRFIHTSNSNRTKASLVWKDNWISFLDSIFQVIAFSRDFEGVSKPSLIKKLTINVETHNEEKHDVDDYLTCINANLYRLYDYTKCGGVDVEGLVFKDTPVTEQTQDLLLTKNFVPHSFTGLVDLKTALQVNLQLVADNVTKSEVKITDVLSKKSCEITKQIVNATANIPSAQFFVKSYGDKVDVVINNGIKTADLLVIDDLLGDEEKMKKIYNAISTSTFILALEQESVSINAKHQLFDIITAMAVKKQTLLLLRKVDVSTDANITYLPIIQDQKFSWIPRLQTELKKSRKVILVSENQPYCGLLGMVKNLRIEYGNKIGLVLIEDNAVPKFNPENTIYGEQMKKNLAFNILKKGIWGSYCVISGDAVMNAQNVQLTSTIPGDIEHLTWVEQPVTPMSNMQVQVYYSGLSFRDIKMAASTNITDEQYERYGMDFSGINCRGEKVMGLVAEGAIASTVEADPDLLWPVPKHWTLEDAATVPLPYLYAYYCLNKCNFILKFSIKVLVHGGTGALGQAAIAISLSLGFTVYTTVSDAIQKKLLLKLFPNLDEKKVITMDNESFQNTIRFDTKNTCCDIVFNCYSGKVREETMKCVGYDGILLDLGVDDMIKDEEFGMDYLSLSRRYIVSQLSNIFRPEFESDKKRLQSLLAQGIATGVVRPLSRVVYPQSSVSRAFRLLASTRHISKVLIRMRESETLKSIKAHSRLTYSPSGTYILVCKDTVSGMEWADRLVEQGARNLVIHVQPNSLAGYCYTKIIAWKKLNVTLKLSTENLQTEKGCLNLLKEGAKLGPILGISIVQNCSGTESLDSEDVAAKFNHTAGVVGNLDVTSRSVCDQLEHFVVLTFSRQTVSDEYIASAVEGICSSRQDNNLPALSFRVVPAKELDDPNNPERSRKSLTATFNAVENSLKLKHNNVLFFNLKKNAASDFMKKISNILGFKNMNTVDENIPLKNLALDEIIVEEINAAIKASYRVSYSNEKVEEMTIAALKNLESSLQETSKATDGLGAFFTCIDKDECMAAEPIVSMATTFSSVEEEDELDPKATYLMLMPGFEGHHQIFNAISERLKIQALAFQYGPELTNADIPEMVAHILKFIKRRFEVKSKFYLLGYSFGVNVALELAAVIEKEGHVGVVYCLDSSPDALRAQLNAYVGHLTDSQLQDSLVEHMYKLMNGRNSEELVNKLEGKTWNDKIELLVSKLRGTVDFSHQYKRCILQGAYRRIMLAREYEPTFKLESEIILMRGTPHPKVESLPDDYGLSKYTTKPVKVLDIEADHVSAPYDCRVTNIVNKLLEPKFLDDFKNKNLCWSYLASPIKQW